MICVYKNLIKNNFNIEKTMKEVIDIYISENSIINRVKNQSLDIFFTIVDNSMFDKHIESGNEIIISKILKVACSANDLVLVKKILLMRPDKNFREYTYNLLGTILNVALNYNAIGVFTLLYSSDKLHKELYIMHGQINPKLLEILLIEKHNALNFISFSKILKSLHETTISNVKLMIKYKVNFKEEKANSLNENPNLSIVNKYLDDIDTDTSLMFMASVLNTTISDLLYDPNYINSCGKTLLHFAIKYGHNFIAKHLIKKGFNINVKDFNFTTPLHLTCKFNNIEMAEYLLSKGAFNTLDKVNRSAAFYAVIKGNLLILQLLNQYNYIDADKKNLLDYAFEYRRFDIAEYLYNEHVKDNIEYLQEFKKMKI